MPWLSNLPNALELLLRLQPLCRHQLWQLLVRYLALGTTGNREQRLEKRTSSATLLLIQPRRNRCVLGLYNCIVTRPEFLWSIRHAESRVVDFYINLAAISHKSPSSL